jgi:hypothetical protein
MKLKTRFGAGKGFSVLENNELGVLQRTPFRATVKALEIWSHDDTAEWLRMVDNLRAARKERGKARNSGFSPSAGLVVQFWDLAPVTGRH